MLLSDWYIKWKETRIKEAAERARAEGYEEGFAVAQSANRKTDTDVVTRGSSKGDVVIHGRKGKVVKTTGKRK